MRLPGDPILIPPRTSRSGYTTILTCRDQERGGKLVQEIAKESGVRSHPGDNIGANGTSQKWTPP